MSGFEEEAGKQPDKRQASNGLKYRIMDALKSGLAPVFERSLASAEEEGIMSSGG